MPVPSASAAEIETANTCEQKSGVYTYGVVDAKKGTIRLTKYEGSDTEFSTDTLIDGKRIAAIGKSAFRSNDTLKKVTITDNVTSIEEKAFAECSKLEEVKIGKGVKKIENECFL